MRNEQVRKKWYREEAPIKQYPRANTCASIIAPQRAKWKRGEESHAATKQTSIELEYALCLWNVNITIMKLELAVLIQFGQAQRAEVL